MNSELKQRVRPVNGLTVHKAVAKQDIKHAAKIIQNLDNRFGIWDDLPEDKKESERMVKHQSHLYLSQSLLKFYKFLAQHSIYNRPLT